MSLTNRLQVIEKVNAQFLTFLEDDAEGVDLEVVNMFTAIVPHLKTTVRDSGSYFPIPFVCSPQY